MKTLIAVIGSDGKITDETRSAAELIGADIAKAGCVLVCGGHGGVMEAACKGAKEQGGLTVGILSELDKSAANRFVDIAIPTSYGFARNTLVVSSADAVIGLAGSVGTLSEVAFALNYDKPVFLVKGTGGIADAMLNEIPNNRGPPIKVEKVSAEEAVSIALKSID
ncbi:MAG: TIGR00725 family protein [Candidatus Altiarchaeota archaeon]